MPGILGKYSSNIRGLFLMAHALGKFFPAAPAYSNLISPGGTPPTGPDYEKSISGRYMCKIHNIMIVEFALATIREWNAPGGPGRRLFEPDISWGHHFGLLHPNLVDPILQSASS
jgi:hypothetical protein